MKRELTILLTEAFISNATNWIKSVSSTTPEGKPILSFNVFPTPQPLSKMLKVTGNGTPEFYCYIHVKTFI